MKTLLTTGGTGFIGSNFVRKIVDDHMYEARVTVRNQSSFQRIEDIRGGLALHPVDLLDSDQVKRLISRLRPHVVVHFATYGSHLNRETNVREIIRTNLEGTMNLINACREIPLDCFIHTGSSAEYGEKKAPMREIDLPEPNNVYGVTKVASTLYCQYAAKEFNMPIAILRLFSPFGYRDDNDRLIPSVVNACLGRSKLKLSSLKSVRDFIFIEDVMDAYLSVIENIDKAKGEVFNVGSGVQHSVADVVEIIKQITGSSLEPEYCNTNGNQYGPGMWTADISKIKDLLGWQPQFSFEKGLQKTVEFMRAAI